MDAEKPATITEHDCDLCGGPKYLTLDLARKYIGDNEPPVICDGCGFVYVRNRRSPEEIARAWDDIWGEGYTSEWPGVKARLYYVAEWCERQFRWANKRVLDIGAGQGTFMNFIRFHGAQSVGIEPCHKNVERITHAGMMAVEGTADHPRLDKLGPFDVVTILWTLENCGDCIAMLNRASGLLKPDGLMVIATGSRILVPFKKPLSSYFSKNPADLHCFRWSKNSLRHALRLVNFHVAAWNDLEQSDHMVAIAARGGIPRNLRPSLDDPYQVLAHFKQWDRLFP